MGTINVIFATPSRDAGPSSKIISIASRLDLEEQVRESKKGKIEIQPTLGFSDEDKIGTFQPHDDALVVTLRIREYDMKGVLVDQGSGAEIMYPNLYHELNLKPRDLSKYDSPIVGFDGKMVIPKGMIKLPVQTGYEVVKVEFIMVNAYSPYTTILARPWLHAIE